MTFMTLSLLGWALLIKLYGSTQVAWISSSPHRFWGDIGSPRVTEHWANHCATREHYQPLHSVFSAGCPTTIKSTELDWNTCILLLPYSRKQKREHVCMRLYKLNNNFIFYIVCKLKCLQMYSCKNNMVKKCGSDPPALNDGSPLKHIIMTFL
jgi:hypothetical protein